MRDKLTLLLLYGGKSVEHEISIRSASNVFENVDRQKFDVVAVGIDKNGIWYLNEKVTSEIVKCEKVAPVPGDGRPKLINIDSNKLIDFDIVFPVLHGTGGEDGAVQGLFKTYSVPVVGCNVLGSAISMDKIVSKILLEASGIPVARYRYFHKSESKNIDYQSIKKFLGSPFMMKAGALGSSVGVYKIKGQQEFYDRLDECFRFGNRVLIEECVNGREMECGVIGNLNPEVSHPGEIVLKKDYDFYTYEAKYQDEDAIDIVVPAAVSDIQRDTVMKYCKQAFIALHCDDYARVDLFLRENGEVVINEVNTIPGFTNVSMFSMLWENMGIPYTQLITKLVDLAKTRWEEESQFETNYDNA